MIDPNLPDPYVDEVPLDPGEQLPTPARNKRHPTGGGTGATRGTIRRMTKPAPAPLVNPAEPSRSPASRY